MRRKTVERIAREAVYRVHAASLGHRCDAELTRPHISKQQCVLPKGHAGGHQWQPDHTAYYWDCDR